MQNTSKALLDTAQAAEFLSISPTTLTTWRCRKTYSLPFFKIGAKVRYSEADLIKFLESRRVGMAVPA